jgi:hypothetical protein
MREIIVAKRLSAAQWHLTMCFHMCARPCLLLEKPSVRCLLSLNCSHSVLCPWVRKVKFGRDAAPHQAKRLFFYLGYDTSCGTHSAKEQKAHILNLKISAFAFVIPIQNINVENARFLVRDDARIICRIADLRIRCRKQSAAFEIFSSAFKPKM